MAAQILPLPTKAVTEEKNEHLYGPTPSHGSLKTNTLFMKTWIHDSRHSIINTESEEETRKSGMGRGHWFTGICYNCLEL